MPSVDYAASLLASAAAPALFLGVAFGNDALLSKSASESITKAIRDVTTDPKSSQWTFALEELLAEYFPPRGNPLKFWTYVGAVTLISLACMLFVYCTRMPGLIAQLLTPGFLRQFVGNGIVITLIVNAIAYRQYRYLIGSFVSGSALRNLFWLFADACLKAVLFIAVTALIYAVFALTTRAFGGHVGDALHAVPITIREALLFHNLTSVYVYSLVLSSFPIYLVVVVKLFVLHPKLALFVQRVIFFLPIAEKPIRAAALVFFLFASIFALTLSLFIAPALQLMGR